jgi:hypothetical protein
LNTQNLVEDWRRQIAISHVKIRAESRRTVLAELDRRGSLLPGVAEVLADRWAYMFDNASAEVIADYVSRHLTDKEVVRISNDSGLRQDTAVGVGVLPRR